MSWIINEPQYLQNGQKSTPFLKQGIKTECDNFYLRIIFSDFNNLVPCFDQRVFDFVHYWPSYTCMNLVRQKNDISLIIQDPKHR